MTVLDASPPLSSLAAGATGEPPHSPETGPETEAWPLRSASGLTLFVPASMRSMSTYVLLEQERWFEPEVSLVAHLLQPGMNALDIGANHGMYTLEMARCVGSGHVWAFEPTLAPRSCLQRSVRANGEQDRVTVVAAGLSDSAGPASFAIHGNSEMNSRDGHSLQRETVRLETLDGYLAQHAIDVPLGFVKLDAEGDELRVMAGASHFFATQSPVVMFEFKHGLAVNSALIGAWLALGFEPFRWSAELELLLPFDAAVDEIACALNLVAVRPQQQRALAARGLLATAQELRQAEPAAADPGCLLAWCAHPALRGSALDMPDTPDAPDAATTAVAAADLRAAVAAAAGETYTQALCEVASAHLQAGLSPAQRVALLVRSRESLLAAAARGETFGPEAWCLVVHCRHALGEPGGAVAMGSELLAYWQAQPEQALSADALLPSEQSGPLVPSMPSMPSMPSVPSVPSVPFVPPQRADLDRVRSTDAASWLRQVLAEFVAVRGNFSSYFVAPEPQRWAALLQHPDHSAEIERRYLLAHVSHDRVACLDGLRLLPDPRHTCNPQLWQSLIEAMRPTPPAPRARVAGGH